MICSRPASSLIAKHSGVEVRALSVCLSLPFSLFTAGRVKCEQAINYVIGEGTEGRTRTQPHHTSAAHVRGMQVGLKRATRCSEVPRQDNEPRTEKFELIISINCAINRQMAAGNLIILI